MIPKRRLLVNASASFIQVVVVGLTFLVIYRFVKDELGISQFGVWALVLATVSVNHVANLGVASSTVKFVPMYLAREMPERAVQVIETSAITLGVFLAVVLPLVYPLLSFVIEKAVEPDLLSLAQAVLPYAILSFWFNALSAVLQGCLDGYQRVDLRSFLVTGAALIYLPLVFWLVKANGLVGLAQAQLVQAVLLLSAIWIVLRRLESSLPLLPFRWSYQTFRETLEYSLTFQGIGLTKLLFEPAAKVMLARFAGSATLGYFEFAHRMVFQLRSLIVTAYQAVVPTIADLHERRPELVRQIYTESARFLVYLVGPSLAFLIVVSPIVSRVWIGTVVPEFVRFAELVFVAWFLNILSTPAYFANAGTGHLRWNFLGHLITGVLNVVLGIVFGYYFGGTGVVVAFSFALLTGSFATAAAYHVEHRISLKAFFDHQTVILLTICVLLLAAGEAAYVFLVGYVPGDALYVAVPILFLLVISPMLWLHPQRQRLSSAARNVISTNFDRDAGSSGSSDDR